LLEKHIELALTVPWKSS